MIISGRPPNFQKILKVFPKAAGKGTIFAYAPYIYVSGKPELSPALTKHEHLHLLRQMMYVSGPEEWWDRYLTDREFRLEEELVAHVEEYKHLQEHGSRAERRDALKVVADRLSSMLYLLNIIPKQAARLIVERAYGAK